MKYASVFSTFVIAALLLLFTRCIEMGAYYAGFHMQPDIDRASFTPGLNVYGILKAGPSFDTLDHYFEVQRVLYVFDSIEGFPVADASIVLKRISGGNEVARYTVPHIRDGIYRHAFLDVAPGEHWEFSCRDDSFSVFSYCVVPNTPVLKGSVSCPTDREVRFILEPDSTAYMYWVYLTGPGENIFIHRQVSTRGEETSFYLTPDWPVEKGKTVLYVFAFDRNLEHYTTTSNIFFKPNAFRPMFSTVEGGYGTFGAVSSTLILIE
ncbi:MAG TPA: hypothetical protein PLK12_02870 [Prolixibacteraceae bacterium]|nr:hypothetical protein [Prolixibacteraceae bacterium]